METEAFLSLQLQDTSKEPKMSSSSAGIKRKRVCLSIATKLSIVERVENGESISKLASEFNIGNQTVRDMIRKKDKLYRFVISSNTLDVAGGRKTIKGSKFDDLDRAVFEWFKQQRAEGRPVTGPVVLEKAKCLHSEMKIPEPFAASQGWLQCFKTRHGIKQWDVQGDLSPAALYVTEFNRLFEGHDFTPDQLYNAGATALYWKALPPKTLMSQPGLGQKPSNERITVLACANASGSHKMKLLCVGKSKNPRSFRGTQMCHFPVIYYSQTKAQMSWDVLKDWFFNHFVPDVRDYLQSKNLSQKAVLLLGQAPSHPKENVLKTSDGQIYVAYMFPNGTSLKQPMDHGLHEFKRRYRKSLLRSVLEENPRLREFNAKWTVKNAIFSCSECWEELPVAVIQKSWRSLFPDLMKTVKVEDGSENQEVTATSLWENVQNIRGFEDVKKEDIEEWLLSDNDNDNHRNDDEDECKTDEVGVTIKEEQPDENSTEIEDEPAERRISITEALNCAETLLDFLDQEPDSNYSQILSLRELRKSLKLKLKEASQERLSDFFQENSLTKT